ncbi:MAG: FkbM family methyltransferase [Thaumarchaeota archaeon]|nr:FkbM family methyltransferase [Nitrososphaerota archaeon]
MSSLIDGLLYRLVYWLRVLKNTRPADWRIALGIFLSMLLDIPVYLFFRNNPLIFLGGKVFLPRANLYFYVRSMTEDFYYVIPRREGVIEDFILNTLNDRDVFVDIGANVGYYTVLAAKKVGTKGVVFAIEPVAETARILKLNLRLNDIRNVIIINKAAWHRPEKIRIHIPIFHGGRFYGLSTALKPATTSIDEIVEGVPLDSLVKSSRNIMLIKIDVEGAEDKVLLGAYNLLKKASYIYIECGKKNVAKVLRLLNEKGFSYRIINVPHATHLLCRRIPRGLNENAKE